MKTVPNWTPAHAEALRTALRQTQEDFAEQLGIGARTVKKWKAEPALTISALIQAMLDTRLEQATEAERERFAHLAGETATRDERRAALAEQLHAATHLHSALDWLDQQGVTDSGAAVVSAALARVAKGRDGARWRTSPVHRADVAALLHDYYRAGFGEHRPVTAIWAREDVALTILSAPGWLARKVGDTAGEHSRFSFDHAAESVKVEPTPEWQSAALARLADCLVDGTRFVDGTLYRMTGLHSSAGNVGASFTTDSFARYALSWDLLEAETFAAVQAGSNDLSLRDQLLPTVADVLAPGQRYCMGGPLALTAFAREADARRGRPADYAILVQERGGQVLNASKRLAVIPKCFHEPIAEPTWEVDVASSIARELEEELFGREEVDTTGAGHNAIDPMHPDLMTAPMRFLMQGDASAWTVETTGFGFNLLTGNYEFPSLIAVHDSEFWQRFRPDIATNWEAAGVRLVSSRDPQGLMNLALDPAWSDEGLFAFLLGLRRLKELAPDRVTMPDIEIGFVS